MNAITSPNAGGASLVFQIWCILQTREAGIGLTSSQAVGHHAEVLLLAFRLFASSRHFVDRRQVGQTLGGTSDVRSSHGREDDCV